MSLPGAPDPIGAALTSLPTLEPDRVRVEAFRRRARAQLARRAAHTRGADAVGRSWTAVAVPVLLGLFSLLYTAALLGTTLRIEGWLP